MQLCVAPQHRAQPRIAGWQIGYERSGQKRGPRLSAVNLGVFVGRDTFVFGVGGVGVGMGWIRRGGDGEASV